MNLLKILEMEIGNHESIYLHREGNEWYAYECSAFYLNSAFQVKRIEQVVDHICQINLIRIPLGKEPWEFFNAPKEVKEYGKDLVEIKCKLKYGGFHLWKSCFIF